ncbi:Conserved hypothetical protein [Prochlorococcus marinus str. MIT 9303]|uniref:Uncharacterized protein n=1 Tax=Prochlorococcus marinus (strain MIT 9303) TaxID=59922 RepID=A2C775_PROM3|nr:Conserved hypothetical protein [Prochlorococcus marinus str. MIT 9303]
MVGTAGPNLYAADSAFASGCALLTSTEEKGTFLISGMQITFEHLR